MVSQGHWEAAIPHLIGQLASNLVLMENSCRVEMQLRSQMMVV